MVRYGKETRRSPAEVMERARKFFGPQGLGLTAEEQGDCCLYLSGGGGYVRVQVAVGEGGRTLVTLETREWDQQAMRFLEEV